ncbi:MAG: RNA polymerase sigma-70 factor [Mucilaginibacter sp.]|uniref:RNA polymerase sigma factor n=1 Tax=Mucilaginibacter sp. TaxID=1882438 RepID=UPI003263B257
MPLYSTLTDNELIVLLNEGDQLAYTEIYNRYWAVLYSHSRRMLRDDDEAMDIVQDVFTMLWKKASELNFTTSVQAYLYSSVRNQTLNYINRSKLKNNYLESLADFLEQGENVTDDQVIYREFVARIDKEISNLPPKMREIFEMSRNIGLSHKDIAEKLNITDHTVKKTINRALKLLRNQFPVFFTLF